ncbi:MAG TPA: hypothetical protein ENO01_00165 [Candidatus Marinimicrobia bacterium]|nr:hypothetical protein [Candidatus Neomarinimicrobiota bacterium]
MTLERAIEIIHTKREAEKNKVIQEFPEKPGLKILNGRYGPYISYKRKNYRIPKKTDPARLNVDECMTIINAGGTKKKKKT